MISYIFSTSPSEHTDFIYSEIKERIKRGENSFILVPEQYSMFSERELLKRLGFSAQKHVQVLTFSRLSNIILSRTGPLRLKYIDSAGKNMLAQRAVQLIGSKLSYFTHGYVQKGFSSVLVKTFSEFKRYGITADALSEAESKTEDEELCAKLSDLRLLYEKYDMLLNEKNSDAEDNLKLIIPKIELSGGISGKFFVNRFKSFTPVEYEALFALIKKNDFSFAFVSDNLKNPEGIFRSAGLTYKNLCEFAEKSGVVSEKPLFLPESGQSKKNAELEFLKENFLKPQPKKYPSFPKNISLVRPANLYDEVSCAADRITMLMRNESYRFEDFLILVSQAEIYEDIIPVVFEKYGINYFIDTKVSFALKPFIRFFSAILEILAYGFSYERITTYLKAGYLPLNQKECDMFENYLLAAGLSDRHYQSEKPFSFNPDKRLFSLEKINGIKNRVINPLVDLSRPEGRKNVKKISKAVLDLLSQYKIKQRFQKNIDTLLKQGKTEEARETETVWNTLMTVIAQTDDLFGDMPITFKKYYEIFSSAISDIKIGAVPPLINQVIISETENFRAAEAKAVIVLGCNEGAFPKSFSEDGVISDKERAELKESGFLLAPGVYEKQWDEQLLVYSVLTAPKEKLILSSPVGGSGGDEILCSEIFSDIKNIFPELSEEQSSSFDIPESPEGAFERLTLSLSGNGGSAENLPPVLKELCSGFMKIPEYSKRLSKLKNALSFENERMQIDKKTAKLLYGEPLMMSVSKLEKYNGCAFSYFLTYGLLLSERKKAALQSADVGSVLHKILSVYFSDRKKENAEYKKITKQDVRREVEKITDGDRELTSSVIYETSSYYRYMLLKIKDIATLTAWKIVKFYAQSPFRPYGFEIKIESDGTFPPFSIKLEDGEAKLRGFIDRMDIYEKDGKKYFNIIDYKSSDKKIDPRLAELGVRFQPLLYAGIVEENIENSQPAAMVYMTMDDPLAEFSEKPSEQELENQVLNQLSLNGIILEDKEIIKELDAEYGEKNSVHYAPTARGCAYSADELEKMINKAMETAAKTSQKISDGYIEINPVIEKTKFNACEYCKFSACCGIKY